MRGGAALLNHQRMTVSKVQQRSGGGAEEVLTARGNDAQNSNVTTTRMPISGRSAFILAIAIGALLGACAEQILVFRSIPFPTVLSWEYWAVNLVPEGAIAGALIANLAWTLADLRTRMRRAAAFAVAANAIVWVAFFIVVPPLTSTELEQILAAWNPRDVVPV